LGEGELRLSEDDEGKRGGPGLGARGGYAVPAGASTFTGRESGAWHVSMTETRGAGWPGRGKPCALLPRGAFCGILYM
jgi:hypothetical protein